MRVGTRNKVRFRMFGLRMTMCSEVLEWDVGRRMVIQSIKPRRPVVGIATHSFEPHEEGTLYTWAMEVQPTMPGGFLFAWLFSRFMRGAARKQQRRFKEIMKRQ